MRPWSVIVSLLSVLLLSSCTHKDLCLDHYEHAPSLAVKVEAAWERCWERDYGCGWERCWNDSWGCGYEDLRPGIPEGIRLIAYHESGHKKEFNLESDGKTVVLDNEGEYTFLLYNNDTEYIIYEDLSSSKDATATTRNTARGEFRSPNENERVMNQPDMLFGRHIEGWHAEKKVGAEPMKVEMKPLVYTYFVRFAFSSGFEYVSKAQGVMAGMAETVYLYDGHTGPESASIMFYCDASDGCLSSKVMTFGVPDHPGDHYSKVEDDDEYMIRLEVMMINGNVKTFDIDISDQMKDQPRGGVIEVKDLMITDEEGQKPVVGGGGFGVGVDEWGENVEVPLPLN